MTMHTPPVNQGQIVERSYGWSEGTLYRCVHDHARGSVQWYVASDRDEVAAYLISGDEPWNTVPTVRTWAPCAEPREAS